MYVNNENDVFYDRYCGTFILRAFVISQTVLACCFLLLLLTSTSEHVLL